MAKSQETYNKKEKEKKRLKKRQDKNLKMEERKSNPTASGLEAMMAYVDENGHISDTPPDPATKKKIALSSIEISVPKRVEEEMPAVRTGRIDFFNHQKGFGFIKENETQEKYFVHVHGLLQEVEEGNAVSFELERGMKGMNAVRVKKI